MRYIVCNADEGEPGTFKDRIIMEGDPHLLVEGMVIAAYAVGAERGYIYIRGEYHQSITMIRNAVVQAHSHGFLGNNILGSGFSLDIEIKPGAGSYLCGEELTLLESLEGKKRLSTNQTAISGRKRFVRSAYIDRQCRDAFPYSGHCDQWRPLVSTTRHRNVPRHQNFYHQR